MSLGDAYAAPAMGRPSRSEPGRPMAPHSTSAGPPVVPRCRSCDAPTMPGKDMCPSHQAARFGPLPPTPLERHLAERERRKAIEGLLHILAGLDDSQPLSG